MIAEKHSYLDKSIDFIICDILEYDMKSAGPSIIKEHGLLSEQVIAHLDTLPKFEKNKAIGNLDRKHKDWGLMKSINSYITQYRIQFCEENEVEDDDILSIKKDAMFVRKYCRHTTFPKVGASETNIKFDIKNHYSAYLYLDKKEVYYNKQGLDIKGINDEILTVHEEYIMKFLHQMITILTGYNYEMFKRKLVDFANKYKRRELPIGYYREFNDSSQYKAFIAGNIVMLDDLGDISICDISYNYNNIIVPLLGLVV